MPTGEIIILIVFAVAIVIGTFSLMNRGIHLDLSDREKRAAARRRRGPRRPAGHGGHAGHHGAA